MDEGTVVVVCLGDLVWSCNVGFGGILGWNLMSVMVWILDA
jgi:hypothetical protein